MPVHGRQGCSPSHVAGKWAYWTQGNVVSTGPRVSAGILTRDTSENVLRGKATSSLNGTIFSERTARFVAGSVVHWNGGARTTTFVSHSELKAKILAADI